MDNLDTLFKDWEKSLSVPGDHTEEIKEINKLLQSVQDKLISKIEEGIKKEETEVKQTEERLQRLQSGGSNNMGHQENSLETIYKETSKKRVLAVDEMKAESANVTKSAEVTCLSKDKSDILKEICMEAEKFCMKEAKEQRKKMESITLLKEGGSNGDKRSEDLLEIQKSVKAHVLPKLHKKFDEQLWKHLHKKYPNKISKELYNKKGMANYRNYCVNLAWESSLLCEPCKQIWDASGTQFEMNKLFQLDGQIDEGDELRVYLPAVVQGNKIKIKGGANVMKSSHTTASKNMNF